MAREAPGGDLASNPRARRLAGLRLRLPRREVPPARGARPNGEAHGSPSRGPVVRRHVRCPALASRAPASPPLHLGALGRTTDDARGGPRRGSCLEPPGARFSAGLASLRRMPRPCAGASTSPTSPLLALLFDRPNLPTTRLTIPTPSDSSRPFSSVSTPSATSSPPSARPGTSPRTSHSASPSAPPRSGVSLRGAGMRGSARSTNGTGLNSPRPWSASPRRTSSATSSSSGSRQASTPATASSWRRGSTRTSCAGAVENAAVGERPPLCRRREGRLSICRAISSETRRRGASSGSGEFPSSPSSARASAARRRSRRRSCRTCRSRSTSTSNGPRMRRS